jgi:hypothetical protein
MLFKNIKLISQFLITEIDNYIHFKFPAVKVVREIFIKCIIIILHYYSYNITSYFCSFILKKS